MTRTEAVDTAIERAARDENPIRGERRAELDAGCQVCAERDQSEAEARDGLETAYELGGF